MDIGSVSTRYAKALMQYATDTGTSEMVYKAMSALEKNFVTQPRLRTALENPVIGVREKLALLQTASIGREALPRELSRFFTLVLKNGRETLMHYIALAFLDDYRRMHNITVGRLVTAVPVSEEVRRRITIGTSTRLKTHTELRTEVDPSIEGGFVLTIDGVRLDASIATQLKQVKKQFIDKNRRIV
ncbi:MAG: F0F1 ATP synthase subunit delta [Bacteroides sp.]|nr:F0F1 ATP synthase subunit delta [Bacteroides sp.]